MYASTSDKSIRPTPTEFQFSLYTRASQQVPLQKHSKKPSLLKWWESHFPTIELFIAIIIISNDKLTFMEC